MPKTVIHIDGASSGNPGPAGAGFVVLRDGKLVHEESIPLGRSTNNQAEYQALLAALRWIAHSGLEGHVEIRTDSALLYNHLIGRFRVKDAELARLLESARALLSRLDVEVNWMPRAGNLADSRAKKAAAVSRQRRSKEENDR